MVFLVFGVLLHSPLIIADDDNDSDDDNSSISGNDNEDDEENDSDDEEDEREAEIKENQRKAEIRARELIRERECVIKIEKEIKIEDGKSVEIVKRKRVCADGTKEEVKIKIENRTEGGRIRERIKYEFEGEEKEIETEEGIKLEESISGTEYKLKARFRGNVTDIKVMPDRASAIALERLKALNFTIELKEVGRDGNVSKLVYQARAYKDGKFIGIFKLKVRVETHIDPETGEVIITTKPWWAFFVAGEDSDQVGKKTTLCHIPPGNPEERKTISVGTPAVPAHLAHGDTLGPCPGDNNETNQTDTEPPKWFDNSTNSTTNGALIEHRVRWTDNVSLSGYIFSLDSIGNETFLNDSFVAFSGPENWSNVSKIINSTTNATIHWRVYANDTSNNWNQTSIFSYGITSQ